MKIVVAGVGSIGSRHLKNLANLGHEVYAFDVNADRLSSARASCKGAFSRIEDALSIGPDAAFVCTYSDTHVPLALRFAGAGCHLFIEKPLSLTLDGVEGLKAAVKKGRLVSLVGCNMRFHPGILYMKRILDNNPAFLKPLWANLEFGYYLPFAKKDYKSSYMANKAMGGNMIFNLIHEIDYAVWFFGEPSEVFCTKGILSNLEIDTEDAVEMIVNFKSGVRCSIHMDYLQHTYCRRCKIVSEKGTAAWDYTMGRAGFVTYSDEEWAWDDIPSDLDYNRMYVDEVQYFFECVKSGKETFNSIGAAETAMNTALAAERSCRSGSWERIA